MVRIPVVHMLLEGMDSPQQTDALINGRIQVGIVRNAYHESSNWYGS